MKNKSTKKSKIDSSHETLALAKSERPVPAPFDLSIDENRIEKELGRIDSSLFEIGKTLAKIRDEKLFPESTFEKYLKRRWNRERDWGYKMIQGYQAKAALPENVLQIIQTSVDNKGLNQKQLRELSKIAPEKQAQILDEVAKEGKVTAQKIAEKAKPKEAEFRIVVKDANGTELPEEIAKEFINSQEETKHIRSLLNEVRRWLENEEPFKVEISRTAAIEGVRDVLGMVAVGSGEFLCPYCGGKKCKVCQKRGFVSKTFYTQSIPDDKK